MCLIGICAAPKGMVFEPFWSENWHRFLKLGVLSDCLKYDIDFCHFGLKRETFLRVRSEIWSRKSHILV